MSYTEFSELILEALEAIIPEGIQIKLITTEKINNCIRKGVVFEQKEVNYAPVIYLEPFYEVFRQGHTVEAVAEEVYRCFIEDTGAVGEEVDEFISFEKAKKNIFAKIIHIEENKKMLEKIPHWIYLDFAIIPYFEVQNDHIYRGSIQINHEHMKFWRLDKDTLLEWAITNTKQSKETLFCPMADLMMGLFDEDDTEAVRCASHNFYVLTNKEKFLGAVQVCFPEVVKDIHFILGCSFFLLPSSIHEWIIVPENCTFKADTLWDTVQHVNKYGVQDEEILSGNIYYYSAISQKIQIYDVGNVKND